MLTEEHMLNLDNWGFYHSDSNKLDVKILPFSKAIQSSENVRHPGNIIITIRYYQSQMASVQRDVLYTSWSPFWWSPGCPRSRMRVCFGLSSYYAF